MVEQYHARHDNEGGISLKTEKVHTNNETTEYANQTVQNEQREGRGEEMGEMQRRGNELMENGAGGRNCQWRARCSEMSPAG